MLLYTSTQVTDESFTKDYSEEEDQWWETFLCDSGMSSGGSSPEADHMQKVHHSPKQDVVYHNLGLAAVEQTFQNCETSNSSYGSRNPCDDVCNFYYNGAHQLGGHNDLGLIDEHSSLLEDKATHTVPVDNSREGKAKH